MKVLLVGAWVTLVALGAAYGAALYLPALTAPRGVEAPSLQFVKSRVLNVPMISDGVVQGFMSMQFGMTVDGGPLKALQVPPEVYLLDEAFRTIYTDPALDFRNLAKYDLGKFTGHLVEATNAHLGVPVVKEVLIEQFSYIAKDASRK